MDVDNKTSTTLALQPFAPSAHTGDNLRQRANELIQSQAGLALDTMDSTTAQDIRRLFHELQVHQVELEMQNDELQRHQTELEKQNDALHRAQQALQRERERYSDLYDNAPVGYCSVNEAGLILQINRTAATLLGRPQEELLRQAITRFICHDDQDNFYLLCKRLIATGAPQSSELCMTRKDGTLFWALLQATLARDTSDKPVHRIVLSDITARRQVELDCRIAATVFESTEGMMVTDAHQLIVRVNNAFTDITGYSASDVLGKSPQLLRSGRQDAGLYAEMWRSIELSGAWQGEVWNRRKCGDVYPARLTVTAVRTAHLEVSHYVVTLSDITARKTADEKIRNLAFYDPLTQLPNRRLLMDRLEMALAASIRNQR